jgi:hypothetical protein
VNLTYFEDLILIPAQGVCLQTNTQIHCHNSASVTINELLSEFNSTSIISPSEVGRLTDLLRVGLTLQKKIYVPLLAAAGSFFFISMFLFTIVKWFTKRLLANPNTSSSKRLHFYGQLAIGSIWTSIGLALASVVSLTEVSAAFQFWSVDVAKSTVAAAVGVALPILQWFIVGLSVLLALAITSTIKGAGTSTLPGPGGPLLPRPPPPTYPGGPRPPPPPPR